MFHNTDPNIGIDAGPEPERRETFAEQSIGVQPYLHNQCKCVVGFVADPECETCKGSGWVRVD